MSSSLASSSINGTSTLRINVALTEHDAVKLILDFLQQRELFISMLDVERETGIINGSFSEDILFLRQLILDGQWDDVIDFIQPLKSIEAFNTKQFHYVVLKYQFLELLCLKTESHIENDLAVEQIVKFLNDLRPYAPNDQEYKKLSFLLTLKRLQDHTDYYNWNPCAGRVQCFQEIYPLVHRFLQVDKQVTPIAQGDRLLQLLVKGLLYESCVEHCQARATSTDETIDLSDPSSLLANTRLSDSDVSLLSWLHALPNETFSCPFEQKALALHVDKFQKPILEATWAEQILSTPFKPQTMFPFNATPTGKARSTELMSRSLALQSEGLNRSQIINDSPRKPIHEMSRSLALSNAKEQETKMPLPTVPEALYEGITPARIASPTSKPKSHQAPSPKSNVPEPRRMASPPNITNGIPFNDNRSKIIDPATHRLQEFQRSRAEILKQFDEDEEDSPEFQKPAVSSNNHPNIRAIHDATKYDSLEDVNRSPAFTPLVSLEDAQAIRAVDVHPSGNYFAVGSNSKTLRVCAYPDIKASRTASLPQPAKVLFQKGKHHQGSIYCMGWSPSGRLMATGSNDKSIKVIRLNMDQPDDRTNNTEIELTHHNGTVRDLIFMNPSMKDDSILLSGGAGDCKIYATDVKKETVIKSYSGHQGHIYSLFTWDAHNFLSGSQDGTLRLWDLRQSDCTYVIPSRASNSAVAAVAVDDSGQLLAAGYEDAHCLLYDIRGKRTVQVYQPHSNEIRSVRFSVNSYYLLTTSYDKKVVMTNLSGDLTKPLILSTVATHTDKVIQARWHPREMSFVTTSADRTCVVWAPTSSMNLN